MLPSRSGARGGRGRWRAFAVTEVIGVDPDPLSVVVGIEGAIVQAYL
jgi:hypothetical protein